MAIRFQCKCGKKYKTTDDKIGKKILCTACGEPIIVPEADTVEVEDVGASSSSLAGDLLKVASASSRKKADQDLPDVKQPSLAEDVTDIGRDFARQIGPYAIAVAVACFALYYISASVFNSGPKHPPLGTVTGIITLNGSPLPNAEVVFRPLAGDEDGKQSASVGVTDAQGKFSVNYVKDVPGAAVGQHRVVINARDENGREMIPIRYNHQTELSFEVKEGSNQADFPLTSP